jgi:hypothetical protein
MSPRRMAVGGLCWALFCSWALPFSAAADDIDAILKKGNELRRHGRDREALAEFQRAAQITETPRVTAQIALAEQSLGLWVDSETHMKKALASASDPWIRKNHEVLVGALSIVEQHIGTVEVWGAPEGAEVLLDDKIAGTLPSVGPISFAADEVLLLVRSPGYADFKRTLRLRIGSGIREHVDLRRLGPPAATDNSVAAVAPPPDRTLAAIPTARPGPGPESRPPADLSAADRGGSWRRAMPWTVGGVAVAALGAGIALHLTASGKLSDFNRSCGLDGDRPVYEMGRSPVRTDPECSRLYDSWNSQRRWAFVADGAAAVLAATSAILFATSPRPERRRPNTTALVSCRLGAGAVACEGIF